jgi:hypothetical protein
LTRFLRNSHTDITEASVLAEGRRASPVGNSTNAADREVENGEDRPAADSVEVSQTLSPIPSSLPHQWRRCRSILVS